MTHRRRVAPEIVYAGGVRVRGVARGGVLGLGLLAGCSFQPNAFVSTDGSDGDAAQPAFCDPTDGTLIACYELEGNARDGSANRLDATTSGVTFGAGRIGLAAQVDASSILGIAESSLLDPSAITMEAWIHPTQLPSAGTRAGIIDNNGQYGFFLHPGGDLQCVGLQATANVQAGTWTHVACTYDGTTRIYAGGVLVGMTAGGGGALGTGGTTGISIGGDNPAGSPLVGAIDQLRIFKIARTASEICAAAGTSPCP